MLEVVQPEIEKNESETQETEKPKNEQPKAGKLEVETSNVKIKKVFARYPIAKPSNTPLPSSL
jgi:hypothetical protein